MLRVTTVDPRCLSDPTRTPQGTLRWDLHRAGASSHLTHSHTAPWVWHPEGQSSCLTHCTSGPWEHHCQSTIYAHGKIQKAWSSLAVCCICPRFVHDRTTMNQLCFGKTHWKWTRLIASIIVLFFTSKINSLLKGIIWKKQQKLTTLSDNKIKQIYAHQNRNPICYAVKRLWCQDHRALPTKPVGM